MKHNVHQALGFFLLFLVSEPASAFQSGPSPVLLVQGGKIRGIHLDKTGVSCYKKIPFAAPPLGPLRWKPPQPVIPWEGVLDCTSFGPSPMQAKPSSFFMIGPEFVVPVKPLSEDCLYLNVWTGAKNPGEKRPVLVWIYGGGFFSGGAAAPGYSGEAMAARGIVFVSFNYRLGVFGFLSLPSLTEESPHHTSGNYALMDQIAAIEWVKKNIAAFGGDPDRITIAGQSAGSASVNCLLVSPLAKGLFQAAIGESGSLVLENPVLSMPSLKQAEKAGLQFAAKCGTADLRQLRSLPADSIQQRAAGFFSPIVDGYTMPLSVAEAYQQGKQVHVPVLLGWNGDEGLLLGVSSRAAFLRQASDFGADSLQFRSLFPANTDSESLNSQIRLAVDKTIGLSMYRWAVTQNKSGRPKTFLYQFNRKPPAEGQKKRFGAYHTAEIGYALHNLDSIARKWEPSDRRLEKEISAYWIRFVKTGDPNGMDLPVWKPFTDQDPQCMIFEESSIPARLPDKEALDFLYSHYPGRP